jgi:thiol-disulfide isomerase/thioredoxin
MHGDPNIITLIHSKLISITARMQNTLADNFSLPDKSKRIVSLSQFKHKLILLHYWGTWCGPCLQTLSATEEMERRFESDTSIVCINIALEHNGFDHWKKFIAANHLGGIELYAEDDVLRDRSRPTGFQWVQWFPSYILLDRQGRLISADETRPTPRLEELIKQAESQ